MDHAMVTAHPDVEVDGRVGQTRSEPLMMVGWDMTVGAWIWMSFWMAALLVMTWLLVRQPGRQSPREDAMTLLRARFARGEISQAEFERALDALHSTR